VLFVVFRVNSWIVFYAAQERSTNYTNYTNNTKPIEFGLCLRSQSSSEQLHFSFPQHHPPNHKCKLIAIQSQLTNTVQANDLKDFSTGLHILNTWLQNIFGISKAVPSYGAMLRNRVVMSFPAGTSSAWDSESLFVWGLADTVI
jgi:hypothetical protein